MSERVGTWESAGSSNFIDGSWQASDDEATAANINPARNDDLIGSFTRGSVASLDRAVAAASAAAEAWAATSPVLRARLLTAIARMIERNAEEFARDLSREEGKTLREAQAEVRRGIHVFDFYAGAGHRLGGRLHPSERPGFRIENRRVSLGVVAAITPWNFPFAIPAWKVAPALIAGNAVVLKPASLTPMSAVNLARAAEAAGLPPGILNLVHGDGATLGAAIAAHPGIAAISFTGSTEVGRKLFRAASDVFKPVQTEMGGHNPLVILADADLDDAVAIAVDGAFMSTGQKCTATRRILVEDAAYEPFLERLVAAATALRLGDPLETTTQIGPVISAEQLALDEAGVQGAVAEGARLAAGGHIRDGGPLSRGWFYAPTVLTDVKRDAQIAQKEVFGPIVSIFRVGGLDEAIELANGTEYGLSASICTRDLVAAERFVRASRSGVVAVNAATAGIEVQAPLHGTKASGLGPPEQGDEAIEFFTEPKSVYLRTPGLS